MPRVTYTLQEPNGRKFRIAGTGTTRAAAVAEANAKLALTVGTVLDSSASDDLAAGEVGAANAGASYSDAELTLQSAAGRRVTVHLENISNEYGDAVTGDINLADGAIVLFATNYRDSDGAGGYTPYSGHFVP
jgi:hypothetical protein